MRKIISIVVLASLAMVACGKEESKNNEIVETTTSSTQNVTQTTETPEPSSTTTTTEEENSPAVNMTPPTQKASSTKLAPSGGNIGQISIPAIGLNQPIFEGIDLSVLNKGPGHYPHSPKPCRSGNAAIAGHRTTYTKPFNGLDLLKNGDLINVSTPAGDCVYKYLRTEIVSPSNVSVVNPKDNGANLLTMTACHPKGSAAQRIVVTATLISVTPH